MKSPAIAPGLLLLLLMLAGCSSDGEWRAPYESRVAVPGAKHSTISGSTYVVRPGDSLSSIAMRSGISAHKISARNKLQAPYHLQVGQRLQLKLPRHHVKKTVASVSNSPDKKPAAKSQPVNTRQQQDVIKVTSSPAPIEQKQPQQSDAATQAEQIKQSVKVKMEESSKLHSFLPDSKLRWKWPIKGKIVKSYRPSDPSRRGILISGAEGKKISATESGEIVYSGDGLTGYGQLIIVKHNKSYLSVYAHNRKRLVKKGEWVSRGAPIATMGRSSGKPVLHFEIRHNGDPENPLKYLP